MDELTTECSFDFQATWDTDVLGSMLRHVICGCLCNQELADLQSTGVRIKCLYSTWHKGM